MCYIGDGKIERCQHCSETEFQTLFKITLNVGPPRPAHQLVAPMVQHHSNVGHPQPSRYNCHIDPYGNSTARILFDREQASNQHTQPSRRDAAIGKMMQRKLQRGDADQAPFTRNVQWPSPTAQQVQSNHHFASPVCDGREHNESHQHLPSSSRHNTTTDHTGEYENQRSNQAAFPNYVRREDMEVVTPRMNKLPPKCWEDERIIFPLMLPLVQEQLANEAWFRRQEQRLNDVWGMYGKERKALAAFQAPMLEETWTPVFEEEEILECEIAPWDEVWKRSVLEGEVAMRDILDEDETWPEEAGEEPGNWTREADGMFSSTALKQLLRVSILEDSLREG